MFSSTISFWKNAEAGVVREQTLRLFCCSPVTGISLFCWPDYNLKPGLRLSNLNISHKEELYAKVLKCTAATSSVWTPSSTGPHYLPNSPVTQDFRGVHGHDIWPVQPSWWCQWCQARRRDRTGLFLLLKYCCSIWNMLPIPAAHGVSQCLGWLTGTEPENGICGRSRLSFHLLWSQNVVDALVLPDCAPVDAMCRSSP